MLKLVVHIVTARLVFYGSTVLVGLGLLEITLRHTIFGLTPLDDCSARRKDLYKTTHNTNDYMPPAGFESEFPPCERPQTHALNRAAIGIGNYMALRS
jgi:hypothetical protein